MSEDSQENKPKKLKLSRDKADRSDQPQKSPPSSMKLRRPVEDTEKPERPPMPEANETKATPPPPMSAPPTGQKTVSSEPQATASDGFDPKNPFGDTIKDGDISQPKESPAELPSEPTAKPDKGDEEKLEAAIRSVDEPEQDTWDEQQKSSIATSILVILVLVAILGGSGYGLWMILKPPSGEAPTALSSEISEDTGPKGPIAKAKEAIAQVPVADVGAITADSPPESPKTESTPTGATSEDTPATKTKAAPSTFNTPSSQALVTDFLSTIHIGGVRKGDRPMIILDGEAINRGDLVLESAGLSFEGIRDGKLAFRDSQGIVYLKSF